MAINITSGADNSGSGNSSLVITDRPNLVSSNIYTSSWGAGVPQYLNPAAFTANPVGTFGNLGRDVAVGPGVLNFDLALSRLFSFSERLKLETRFEAFNAINHTNFGTPVTAQNSASFGRLTSANDPRILQFAMKMQF
jgi:hypothetical protein